MNGALDILRRERDDAAEQIRGLRVRIRDLEAAIGVLEGQPAPTRQGRSGSNVKQSTIDLLTEFGQIGATPKELTEALNRLGHSPSEATVSSTLSRLKGDAKVTNRGGRWFAATLSQAQAAPPSPNPNPNPWDDIDDDIPF